MEPLSVGYPAAAWVCVPLATVIVIVDGAADVNTRFKSLPLWAMLNTPPASPLANPPVPLVAEVLIRNLLAANPEIPPAAVAIFHVKFWPASKFAALPLTSGLTPESVQRLTLKGSAEVEAIESVLPTSRRSHDSAAPAAPVAESICQV